MRKVSEQTSSHRKLKQLLILLSRLLFLFFLILTFSRPYFPASEDSLSNSVQIYLDNSYSMSNETDIDLSALDRAVENAMNILELYPSGTQFRLITNDFDPFSNRFRSREEVREKLTEIDLSRFTRDSREIYLKMNDDVAGSANTDSYWISDFQKTSSLQVENDTSFHVRVIPQRFTGIQNIFIDSLYLTNPFVNGSESITLVARFRNTSESDIKNLNTRVFIDENQVSAASINISGNNTTETEFDISLNSDGSGLGRISFEDFPVTFDNDAYFVISGKRKIRVTEIKGSNHSPFIAKVYGNREIFDFSSQEAGSPDFQQISNSDLVILNQLESVNPSLQLQLTSFLKQSGGVVIIPSSAGSADEYSAFSGVRFQLKKDSLNMVELASPDLKNPFFESVFEEQRSNIDMPSAVQRLTWGTDRSSLLNFKTGMPFLSVTRMNSGKVFAFSSSFDLNDTNFPQHALFLPVMYKLAMSSSRQTDPLYYSVSDANMVFSIDSVIFNSVFKIVNNDFELIPGQRVSGNDVFLDIPEGNLLPGFYKILENDRKVKDVALNFSSVESELNQWNSEEILNLFSGGNIEIIENEDGVSLGKVLKERYEVRELWVYFLILALIFLLAEILLIRFMK